MKELGTLKKGFVPGIVIILLIALFPYIQIRASADGLPPIADAGGPYIGYENSNITFDASGSYDPEGDELWYNWDFDNDGYPDLREWLDVSTITWIWYDDYYGDITVFVTDWIDEVTDTTTVTVYNIAPLTELSVETQEEIINFNDIATDPGSDDIIYTWDFGDGTTPITTIYYNNGIAPDPYPSADEYKPMEIVDTQIHTYAYPGLYTVTVTIQDDDGGINIDTMIIQIGGSISPIADAGPDQTVEQTSYAGAEVTLDGSGSYDPDGDPLTYDWTWIGGSALGINPIVILQLGTTTITLTVSDETNSDSDTVDITVVDTTPPEIICPDDVIVELESNEGTVVLLQAIATDLCDSDPIITSNELPIYPLGSTIVTFTATDFSGNSASCSMSVTVLDTTPPEITQIDEPIDLWPPNHKYHTIKISDFVTAVTDINDPDIDIDDVVITSVSSDEPEDVYGNGDGKTLDDIVIVDVQTVNLRSERQGAGNGRVYTINFEVTDLSGNTAIGFFKVCVRHDQGGNPAIDDGADAGYTVYYP